MLTYRKLISGEGCLFCGDVKDSHLVEKTAAKGTGRLYCSIRQKPASNSTWPSQVCHHPAGPLAQELSAPLAHSGLGLRGSGRGCEGAAFAPP